MADYSPGPDADYLAWGTNLVTDANANLAELGLVAADMNADDLLNGHDVQAIVAALVNGTDKQRTAS